MLAADCALDATPAGRADAAPVLQLERVLLQAGEEHRPADRHRESDEGHDLRVSRRHPGTSFARSYVCARADALESTTPDDADRIRACRAPWSRDPRDPASPGRCA